MKFQIDENGNLYVEGGFNVRRKLKEMGFAWKPDFRKWKWENPKKEFPERLEEVYAEGTLEEEEGEAMAKLRTAGEFLEMFRILDWLIENKAQPQGLLANEYIRARRDEGGLKWDLK